MNFSQTNTEISRSEIVKKLIDIYDNGGDNGGDNGCDNDVGHITNNYRKDIISYHNYLHNNNNNGLY